MKKGKSIDYVRKKYGKKNLRELIKYKKLRELNRI